MDLSSGKIKIFSKPVSGLLVIISGVVSFSAISFYKREEKFYRNYLMPLVHLLDPEKAHKLGVIANKYRIFPKSKFINSDILKCQVFQREFENPIGIAAGFDKDAEAVLGLHDQGFGFVEIGSVTPLPQPGNEKPRVFRLSEDSAIINRYGFNSKGHEVVFQQIYNMKQENQYKGIIGVNLGKNKTSDDPINDYIKGIEKFWLVADYLVINISSPNTPGLRQMQNKDELMKLLEAANISRGNLPERPYLLLKLAPDLDKNERKEIAKIIMNEKYQVDGLIICNTTIQRPEFLINSKKNESGGLSGQPLKQLSTEMISDMYILTNKKIPIIGVGGVSTGEDAYEKIKNGATLIQIYSSIIYEGPLIVDKIKKELQELLIRDGYKNVSEAIGKDI